MGRILAFLKSKHLKQVLTILLGVYLLGVPTLFTVYPEYANGQISDGARKAIFVTWLALAIVAGWIAFWRDEWMGRLSDHVVSRRLHRRSLAGSKLIQCVANPVSVGLPAHYEVTVYVPDGNRLSPIYPRKDFPPDADPRSFEFGHGATGKAWEQYGDGKGGQIGGIDTFVVSGDAVSTDLHGLTAAQQDYFAGYKVVASTPILNADEERIGVVTVISKKADKAFDDSGAGHAALRELAEVLGVVLEYVLPG